MARYPLFVGIVVLCVGRAQYARDGSCVTDGTMRRPKNAAGVTGGVNGKGEGQAVTQLLPSSPVCISVVLRSV
ncbi:hypothetical protein HAZ28_001012, partial [Salmonella enterica]|nr:hypothetical protein [Salmonella enterica]